MVLSCVHMQTFSLASSSRAVPLIDRVPFRLDAQVPLKRICQPVCILNLHPPSLHPVRERMSGYFPAAENSSIYIPVWLCIQDCDAVDPSDGLPEMSLALAQELMQVCLHSVLNCTFLLREFLVLLCLWGCNDRKASTRCTQRAPVLTAVCEGAFMK